MLPSVFNFFLYLYSTLIVRPKTFKQCILNTSAVHADPLADLQRIAALKGFVPVDNSGDGNCMFHALSNQLHLKGICVSHEELRKSSVEFLRNNPRLPVSHNKLFWCIVWVRCDLKHKAILNNVKALNVANMVVMLISLTFFITRFNYERVSELVVRLLK